MSELAAILTEFRETASNPKARFQEYLRQGKKVVGCMPYFCPEELVHAAGMVPFGMWGGETSVSEAKRYFPAFICSILQTALELGIKGGYDGLSAVMIPMLCDSLKNMDANWRYGVGDKIPTIPVAHAQNRKTRAGAEFTASQYRIVMARLCEISGKADADIRGSIALYNGRNGAVRRFIDEAARRPGALTPSERSAVFKSSYFMEAEEYTEKVTRLAELLVQLTAPAKGGPNVVTCGIMADNTGLLRILDECGVNVIDDLVTHESIRFRTDVPDSGDPYIALAEQIGLIEGCAVLFDPGKKRAEMLVDIAKKRGADGVLFVMTKFCDPEEYDIVPLKRALDREGIRSVLIETDQQTTDAGQVRTAVETFCDVLAG